jgi:long-chain fatty acid transport protein
MRNITLALALLATSTTLAQAGGLDRSRINFGLLFEEGNYVELGFSHVSPMVAGTYSGVFGPFAGSSTGDMAGDYSSISLSYKHQFSDKVALGLFINSPYGADADYTAGPYSGLNAKWKSRQIAAVLKYDVSDRFSAYGGLKYVRSSAQIGIPAALFQDPAGVLPNPYPAGYAARGEADEQVGYIVGTAYERPEIALRVALTYESGISHSFKTTETGTPLIFGPGAVLSTTTDVEMPQSLTLDFQTGVAKDTLVFGSVRWSEWSVWEIRPPGYDAIINSDITSFDNDVLSLSLGVGRRLNENLSVFARVGYEKANGGVASRLAPTDGSTSIGIGGSYTMDNIKITGGVEYVKVGDAVDGSGVRFAGNDALGVGVSIGIRF